MFFINHTETIKESIVVVEIQGALDSDTSSGFEGYIDQLIENDKLLIVVDADRLDYVSSVGIGAFIYMQKKLNVHNGFISICNLKNEVKSLFELLGFDKVFNIAESKEEALKTLEKQLEIRADPTKISTDEDLNDTDDPIYIETDSSDSYEVHLEGDDSHLEFESPIILECAECKSMVRIKKPGRYICPDCKAEFTVDEDQTIIF